MTASIYTTTEVADWNDALRSAGASDVYFLPQYHEAYQLNGDGLARLFVFRSKTDCLIYPFMLRSIVKVGAENVEGELQDIETVYGYSGPVATTQDKQFLGRGWSAFNDWCVQENVVAEFVRFHPLIGNEVFLDDFAAISVDRQTVVIDLSGSPKDLWDRYPSSQRAKIRRAESENLICHDHAVTEALPHFRDLYERTMRGVGARSYYFFGDSYFKKLASHLSEQIRIFSVYKSDTVIASALFLFRGPYLHYHLGGSDHAHRNLRPNNLLFHTAALWGQASRCRWLHLGGGRTASPDDELLRFKSTFSRERRPFSVAQRVHCKAAFESLCAKWTKQQNGTKHSPYFLLYRLPI